MDKVQDAVVVILCAFILTAINIVLCKVGLTIGQKFGGGGTSYVVVGLIGMFVLSPLVGMGSSLALWRSFRRAGIVTAVLTFLYFGAFGTMLPTMEYGPIVEALLFTIFYPFAVAIGTILAIIRAPEKARTGSPLSPA